MDERYKDPVIEAYKKDVDFTLVIENLKLTHQQRLDQLARMCDFVAEMQASGKRARTNVK